MRLADCTTPEQLKKLTDEHKLEPIAIKPLNSKDTNVTMRHKGRSESFTVKMNNSAMGV